MIKVAVKIKVGCSIKSKGQSVRAATLNLPTNAVTLTLSEHCAECGPAATRPTRRFTDSTSSAARRERAGSGAVRSVEINIISQVSEAGQQVCAVI